MKRVLVDLNVLLDALLDRAPHGRAAAALWAAIEERRLEGLVSAHGFPALFYLVAKSRGRAVARQAMTELLGVFGVAPVDAAVLRRAATLDLADFEDAVSAAAAEASGCEAVVTRDPRGFAGSPIEAIDPALALAALGDEVHEPLGSHAAARRPRRAASPRRRSAG